MSDFQGVCPDLSLWLDDQEEGTRLWRYFLLIAMHVVACGLFIRYVGSPLLEDRNGWGYRQLERLKAVIRNYVNAPPTLNIVHAAINNDDNNINNNNVNNNVNPAGFNEVLEGLEQQGYVVHAVPGVWVSNKRMRQIQDNMLDLRVRIDELSKFTKMGFKHQAAMMEQLEQRSQSIV